MPYNQIQFLFILFFESLNFIHGSLLEIMPRAIIKRNLQFSRMVFLVSEHYEVPLTEKKIKMGKKQHQKDKLYVNYIYFFVYVFSIMSFVET